METKPPPIFIPSFAIKLVITNPAIECSTDTSRSPGSVISPVRPRIRTTEMKSGSDSRVGRDTKSCIGHQPAESLVLLDSTGPTCIQRGLRRSERDVLSPFGGPGSHCLNAAPCPRLLLLFRRRALRLPGRLPPP